MAFSPAQIQNAVQFFTSKNTARANAIGGFTANHLQGSGSSARSGGSGGGGSTSAAQKIANTKSLLTEEKSILPDWLPSWTKDLLGDPRVKVNEDGTTEKNADHFFGDFINDLADDRSEDFRANNAAQGFMDALSSASYGVGRSWDQQAKGIEKLTGVDMATQQQGQSDVGGAIGEFAKIPLGLLGGISEGFGARYDWDGDGAVDKPLAPGEVVTNKTNNFGVGFDPTAQAGSEQGWKQFWAGAGAFAIDVVADPLSYVAGTGIVKGAVKATSAGAGAANASAAAGGNAFRQAFAGFKAAGPGFAEGAKDGFRTVFQKAPDAAAAGVRTAVDSDAADLAADPMAAAPLPIQRGTDLGRMDPIPPLAVGARKPAPETPTTVIPSSGDTFVAGFKEAEAPAGMSLAEATKISGSIDEVLANLGSKADDIPVGEILAAARPAKSGILTEAQATKIADAMYGGKANTVFKAIDDGKVDTPELLIGGAGAREVSLSEVEGTIQALSEKPSTAAFLQADSGVSLPGVAGPLTVADLLRRYADPDLDADTADFLIDAIDERLLLATKLSAEATAESVSAAIAKFFPGAKIDGAGAASRINAATPPQAEAFMRQLIEPLAGGPKFTSLDEAIDAAVDGTLEAEAMREILKALGIQAKINRPDSLRKALIGDGKMRWTEVQNSLRSERELYTDHGIPEIVVQAAAKVDDVAEEATARVEFQETMANAAKADLELDDVTPGALDENGLDVGAGARALIDAEAANIRPTARRDAANGRSVPQGGASTMRAIANGVAAAAARLANPKGRVGQSMVPEVMIDVHRDIVGTLTQRLGGTTGVARGEAFVVAYGKATLGVEEYLRSRGLFPGQAKDFAVSWGQMFDALSSPVAAKLLGADYALGKIERGSARASEGLTLYPNVVSEGVRAAVIAARKGATGEELVARIVAAMDSYNIYSKGKLAGQPMNKFQGKPTDAPTTPGRQMLQQVAEDIARPEYLARMDALNAQQAALMVKIAQNAATEAVVPIWTQIRKAITDDGDRSHLVSILQSAHKSVGDSTAGMEGAPTLQSDIANYALDNAFIEGIAGLDGTLVSRFDAAVGDKLKAIGLDEAKLAAGAEKIGSVGAQGKNATNEKVAAAGSDARTEHLGDIEETVQDRIAEDVAAGVVPDGDAPRTVLEELFRRLMGSSIATPLMKIGHAFLPGFGMGETKHAIGTNAFTEALAVDHMFRKELTSAVKSWRQVISARAGGKVDDAALNARIGVWFNSLRRVRTDNPNLPSAGVLQRLQDGLDGGMVGGRNMPGAAPLEAWEAGLAMELNKLIDQVFAPGASGLLARSAIPTDDFIKAGERFGISQGGRFGAYGPKPGLSMGENASIWTTFDDLEAPLDLLAAWHSAATSASVRPSIGANLRHLFAHSGDGMGQKMTTAEAIAAGWQKVNTDEGSLAKYLGKDEYYAPEDLEQIAFLQKLADDLDEPATRTKFMSAVLPAYDYTVNVLKASQTIWNPRHHVANVMGEYAMLLIARVNPLQSMRVHAAIKASGQMVDVPDEMIEAAAQGVGPVAAKFRDTTAHATINGKNVDIDAEMIARMGMRDGWMLTPAESMDIVGMARDSKTQRFLDKIKTVPGINVLSGANQKLGQFSAWRDNWTRLAHVYHLIESRTFRSQAEMEAYVTAQMTKYHPTIHGLSAFDQKVTRRVFYFHTWARLAAETIVKTAFERPAVITSYSKAQYELAHSQGFDPSSVGNPFGDDERIADYYKGGLLGPTFAGGWAPPSPLGGESDLAPGGTDANGDPIEAEVPNLWGMSLNSPQIDALAGTFRGLSLQGDPWENIASLASGLNPILQAPIELISRQEIGNPNGAPIKSDVDYWFEQTGVLYSVANNLGVVGVKENWTEAQQAGELARKNLNWWTGLKFTNYTNPTSAGVAETQAAEKQREMLEKLGYTADEIKAIRKLWKDQAAQNGE